VTRVASKICWLHFDDMELKIKMNALISDLVLQDKHMIRDVSYALR